MAKPLVAIFMGSASDEESVAPAAAILKDLNIPYLMTVTSAHRTAKRTEDLVDSLEKDGCQVFICAAGLAAPSTAMPCGDFIWPLAVPKAPNADTGAPFGSKI